MHSIAHLIIPVALATATLILIHIIQKVSVRLAGEQRNERLRTLILFTKKSAVALVMVVGILLTLSTIPGLEAVAFSLLASSGIIVTALGFIGQTILSNIMSGFFIQTVRPFSVGDTIKIEGSSGNKAEGRVEEITLYYTLLSTAQKSRIIIPNSLLQTTIIENKGKLGQ